MIAAAVHLFVVGCAVVGLWFVFWLHNFVSIVVGVVLVGLAVVTRPRFGRIDRYATVVEPAQAPLLYDLVNRVAARLGTRPVWRIVLVAEFSAAYGTVGLRRRPVLYLGYPLWNLLTPQERIALLGHEIGHCVNGDLHRSLVVGSSLISLAELHRVLRPGRVVRSRQPLLIMMGEAVARFVMRLLSWPVLGLVLVQERLLAMSGQRAEYYADDLSARAAGAPAAMAALEVAGLGARCVRELHTAIVRRDKDIWASSRAWLAGLSAGERASAGEEPGPHRLAATHPPVSLRIGAIASRGYGSEVLTSSRVEADAVDAELAPLLKPVLDDLRGAAIG